MTAEARRTRIASASAVTDRRYMVEHSAENKRVLAAFHERNPDFHIPILAPNRIVR